MFTQVGQIFNSDKRVIDLRSKRAVPAENILSARIQKAVAKEHSRILKKLMAVQVIIIICFMFSSCFAITGDLNSDNLVNPEDLYIFSGYWLSIPVVDPNCDFDESGFVDFVDFAMLAENWMGGLYLPQRTLTISASSGGTVTTPGIGIYTYDYNTYADIVADANANYSFTNWTGTAVTAGKVASPNSPATTVLMDDNYTIRANFDTNKRFLTTSAGGVGTVTTPGIGIYTYDYNTYADIVADANANYSFTNWTGTAVTAGKVSAPNSASTTVLMDANYTVCANFTAIDYNTPPVVADCNFIGYAFITKEITLTATAGTQPISDYIITATPNDINCYIQDPASGCGKITNNLLPYRLRNHGSKLWLAADNNETFIFKWRATDGTHESNDANCTVAIAANPKDCLTFNECGWVTIPDNSLLDLEPNRAIGFCFKTRNPFCGILKKHEAGKAGYEINLVSGKIVADVYSAAGPVATIKSSFRYDTGGWCNAVFAYNDANDCLGLYISFGNMIPGETWYDNGEILWTFDGSVPIAQGNYSNDCNLVIGKSNGGDYKWEIDAIRAYNLNMADNFRINASIQSRETAGNTETYIPTPIVQFSCNEGTGSTITDSKVSLVGTFGGDVYWTPFNWYWADINVLRYRR